ncbi:hypothetical protein F5X99DRAFT_367970 [Biscogniauxia marginata]|nr:hypothetical protein F5X99DRAFT_367970 [Biscogniauxia marginata]
MLLPPVAVIAKWPKPNYLDPETRGPAGKIIGLMLIIIVTAVLAVRLYARKWLTRGFGLDDTLISLAYAPTLAFTITGLVAEEKFQWNRHIWDVDPELFSIGLRLGLITLILFDLSTSLIKLSMLAMVFRLAAASNDKRTNLFIILLSAVISANSFIFVMVIIFQCRPVSDSWTLSLKSQNCIDEKAHLAAANIINTVTDFIVVLLPIKIAVGLELPVKQRTIVIGLFGTGLLASAAGVARTYFSWVLSTAADRDITWNAWAVWLSSIIELNLGIICASIPGTKPFFASYLPRILGSTLRSRRSRFISWDKVIGGVFDSPVYPTPIKSPYPDSSCQSSPTQPFISHAPLQPYGRQQLVDTNKPLPPIRTPEPAPVRQSKEFAAGHDMRTLTLCAGKRHHQSASF